MEKDQKAEIYLCILVAGSYLTAILLFLLAILAILGLDPKWWIFLIQ